MKNKNKLIEIKKTNNANLIILILSEQIINDVRGYHIESIDDVEYEDFNLPEEVKNICKEIFSIDGIFEIQLNTQEISVFKTNKADWGIIEPKIVSIFK